MRRHALPEDPDEVWIEEQELVRDVEADDARQGGMRGKHALERAALLRIHREDDVRPFEHPAVDAHHGVFTRAGRSHLQIRPFAEDALGGRAAGAIQMANKEDTAWLARLRHRTGIG